MPSSEDNMSGLITLRFGPVICFFHPWDGMDSRIGLSVTDELKDTTVRKTWGSSQANALQQHHFDPVLIQCTDCTSKHHFSWLLLVFKCDLTGFGQSVWSLPNVYMHYITCYQCVVFIFIRPPRTIWGTQMCSATGIDKL